MGRKACGWETWTKEQQKALRKQIFEVQTRRLVRGPAGANMYETRDLGTKWLVVDVRVVYPQDVKKMLLKQARMVNWKMCSKARV